MPISTYVQVQVDKDEIIRSVIDALSPEDRRREGAELRAKLDELLSQELGRRGAFLPTMERQQLLETAVAKLSGLGPLGAFLPPKRTDLQEIALTPDGSVWILRKGQEHFECTGVRISASEAFRFLDVVLGRQGKSLSEATPSVDGYLPPTPDNPAGGRIKALHPGLVGFSGDGCPSINIRLFELKPVLPEQIVKWQVMTPQMLEELGEMVRRKYNIMIAGATGVGKTTLLSALCNYIPKQERIVKIEDPPEIFIDHPHVVTIAAWPAPPGSIVPPYTIRDGVDDALRMKPDRLIVGEVRKGDAALSLFRAHLSGHPGLTTFHADSPEATVKRLALIMFADAGVRTEPAKGLFADAIDVYVQLFYDEGVRRVQGIYEVGEKLKGGNVVFKPLWLYRGDGKWEKLGEPERRK